MTKPLGLDMRPFALLRAGLWALLDRRFPRFAVLA